MSRTEAIQQRGLAFRDVIRQSFEGADVRYPENATDAQVLDVIAGVALTSIRNMAQALRDNATLREQVADLQSRLDTAEVGREQAREKLASWGLTADGDGPIGTA